MLAALYPSGPPPAPPPTTAVNTKKLTLTKAVTTGRASVDGALATAPGPDGRAWKAVGKGGRIDVMTTGTRYLAFKAGSYLVRRKLRLATPDGESRPVRVGTSARAVLIGPFRTRARVRFEIKGSPPPRSPAPGAPAGSFFLSEPVLSAVSAAVLPGRGFWETEYVGGHRSVWLRDYGSVTLVARTTRRAWIRFRAVVLTPQRLIVRLADPPRTRLGRFDLKPGKETVVEVGPVQLHEGVADVRFDAFPGAVQASSDDVRSVSVDFKDLEAAIAIKG